CTGAEDRVFRRSGFTDDLEVLFRIEQEAQSGPHHGVVVDENDLDHSGMSIRMVVPAPGEVSTTIRPSCSSTRSRMPTSPKLPDPTAEGSKPMPSSSMTAVAVLPRRTSRMLTVVLSACLTMFVSASWMIR